MSDAFSQKLMQEQSFRFAKGFGDLPYVQKLDISSISKQGVSLDCLRLDLVHPRVSGNKWYKLKHHLFEAQVRKASHVVSFGGAYSNHLHALAYACSKLQINLTALVRGEEPETLSPTLTDCLAWGAKIVWLPRPDYSLLSKQENVGRVQEQFPGAYVIPEGGEGVMGVKGVYELFRMLQERHTKTYDLWVSGVGSGTTLAGMRLAARMRTEVLGFSALKGAFDLESRVETLVEQARQSGFEMSEHVAWQICHDYHFGGFAKSPERLTNLISAVHSETGMLLDPVYSGKAMFGLLEWIEHNRIRSGSNVLFVHTGGLQGWRGLAQH